MRSLPIATAAAMVAVFMVAFASLSAWAALRYSVPVAVKSASGAWQVVDSPDWVPALLAGSFIGLSAAALVGAVMRHVSGPGRAGRWYLTALLAFTGAVGVATLVPIAVSFMCDGSVPSWMLPEDYNGGGCVMYPVNWETTLPWDDEEMHCLGMCISN